MCVFRKSDTCESITKQTGNAQHSSASAACWTGSFIDAWLWYLLFTSIGAVFKYAYVSGYARSHIVCYIFLKLAK